PSLMPCLDISALIFLAAPSLISIMSIPNYQRPTPNHSQFPTPNLGVGSWQLGVAQPASGVRLRVACTRRHALVLLLLRLVVGDRRLDRVLGQDRAVDLHGRQREFSDDVG